MKSSRMIQCSESRMRDKLRSILAKDLIGGGGVKAQMRELGAQDGNFTLQIVGEHMEAHLSSDLYEGFGPKVGGAHPGF
jgi:hypothetical protein